jgi:hypothetical protein
MSNTKIPGLLLPTQQGMLAGNPRDSAIAQGNAAELKLQALQSIGGGKKRNKKWCGAGAGSGTIVVPQFNMQYTPQGGPDQVPNSIIEANALVGTQSAANAVYDKYALQKGGKYGVDTNQYVWGCYSGGKKYKGRKTHKQSHRKKSTKQHRLNKNLRKTRKTRKARK